MSNCDCFTVRNILGRHVCLECGREFVPKKAVKKKQKRRDKHGD